MINFISINNSISQYEKIRTVDKKLYPLDLKINLIFQEHHNLIELLYEKSPLDIRKYYFLYISSMQSSLTKDKLVEKILKIYEEKIREFIAYILMQISIDTLKSSHKNGSLNDLIDISDLFEEFSENPSYPIIFLIELYNSPNNFKKKPKKYFLNKK